MDTNTTTTYSHNNSGGYDWLDQDDWDRLAAAGWDVDAPYRPGRLPSRAHFPGDADAARHSWINALGLDPDARGCDCCGRPHSFY